MDQGNPMQQQQAVYQQQYMYQPQCYPPTSEPMGQAYMCHPQQQYNGAVPTSAAPMHPAHAPATIYYLPCAYDPSRGQYMPCQPNPVMMSPYPPYVAPTFHNGYYEPMVATPPEEQTLTSPQNSAPIYQRASAQSYKSNEHYYKQNMQSGAGFGANITQESLHPLCTSTPLPTNEMAYINNQQPRGHNQHSPVVQTSQTVMGRSFANGSADRSTTFDAGAAYQQQQTFTKPGTRQFNRSGQKTRLCHAFQMTKTCRNGANCRYAHGQGELQSLAKPNNYSQKPDPRYKTKVCNNFLEGGSGECRYGDLCEFVHPGDRSEKEFADLVANAKKTLPPAMRRASMGTPRYQTGSRYTGAPVYQLKYNEEKPRTRPHLPQQKPPVDNRSNDDGHSDSARGSGRSLGHLRKAASTHCIAPGFEKLSLGADDGYNKENNSSGGNWRGSGHFKTPFNPRYANDKSDARRRSEYNLGKAGLEEHKSNYGNYNNY
ncbi:unnamed protein product, partial [Mesorhabditis spiculigera]